MRGFAKASTYYTYLCSPLKKKSGDYVCKLVLSSHSGYEFNLHLSILLCCEWLLTQNGAGTGIVGDKKLIGFTGFS